MDEFEVLPRPRPPSDEGRDAKRPRRLSPAFAPSPKPAASEHVVGGYTVRYDLPLPSESYRKTKSEERRLEILAGSKPTR